MVLSIQYPFAGEQALDADWSAGVDARRGDANLGAQAEAEAIGEPRTGIVEDAGAVHLLLEVLGRVICASQWKRYFRKISPCNSNEKPLAWRLPFSVTMTSVWLLPYLCTCSMASSRLLTTSIVASSEPYSWRRDLAGGGPNVRV